MSEILYELHDNDNDYEIIASSENFREIKDALIEYICEETWDSEKISVIDNVYSSIEIGSMTYDVSDIVVQFGDLEAVFREIVESELEYMIPPEAGVVLPIEDYVNCCITARIPMTYELTRVHVIDGEPRIISVTYDNEVLFGAAVVNYIIEGWIMAGKRYEDGEVVRICLMSTQ